MVKERFSERQAAVLNAAARLAELAALPETDIVRDAAIQRFEFTFEYPLRGLRDKQVDILRRTFRHFSFVEEVRVFGSRANGIARRSSDLDLAISSPEATPAE